MNDHKEMLIPMLLSAFFGGSTASMAAVKRHVSAGQALIAVGISSIVSASLPWALVAVGCHWGLATLGSAFLGLVIFGFIATTDKASDELPNTDWSKYIPRFPPIVSRTRRTPKPPKPPEGDNGSATS